MTTPREQEILARNELERRVRMKMRDYPELNTLIEGEENDTDQIYYAIDLAMSLAQELPPPIGSPPLHAIPLYLLIPLVVSELLESAAILYIRNDLSFTTGGTTVQFSQGHTYLQMAAQMRAQAKEDLSRWKVAQNHQMAVQSIGGVHSDWAWINSRPLMWYAGDVFDATTW